MKRGDPYLSQTRATVSAVHERARAALAADGHAAWLARLPGGPAPLAFQSKVGPIKWLGPEITYETPPGRRRLPPPAGAAGELHLRAHRDAARARPRAAPRGREPGVQDFDRGAALNLDETWLASAGVTTGRRTLPRRRRVSERTGNVRRVIVVGGGVSGLATALRLLEGAAARRLDLRVDVLESAPDFGGNLRTLARRLAPGGAPTASWTTNRRPCAWSSAWTCNGELVRSSDAARRRFLSGRRPPARDPRLAARLPQDRPVHPGRAKLRVLGELPVPRRRDLGRAADDPRHRRVGLGVRAPAPGTRLRELMLDPMVRASSAATPAGQPGGAFPRMVELEHDHGSLFRALAAISKQRKRPPTPARPAPCTPSATAWRRSPRRWPARCASTPARSWARGRGRRVGLARRRDLACAADGATSTATLSSTPRRPTRPPPTCATSTPRCPACWTASPTCRWP
ncbi:MAG: NAD(P)-binding protein [bacterium]|nr:NAD(P)-binding protein [bacterium]